METHLLWRSAKSDVYEVAEARLPVHGRLFLLWFVAPLRHSFVQLANRLPQRKPVCLRKTRALIVSVFTCNSYLLPQFIFAAITN